MAIISCPECGRQVSDKALKCPQCAHPIANPETRDQLLPPKPLQKEPESIAALMQEWSTQKWLKLLGISITGTIVFIAAIVLLGKGIEASREASRKKELIEEQKQLKEVVSKPTYSVNPSTNSPSTRSPAYLLAGIDKQSKDVSVSELAAYTQLLDQLAPKCQESRMALADLSAWTQDELKKKGVAANHLKIMNAVYQSVQPYTTRQRCESSFVLISKIVNK